MTNTPLVSIIMPVYNGANYLREAIDSALAQTYPNVEILVVNDGSSDGGATEGIALSYGDSIRYFAKENGGVSTALNLGIQNMRGEYFAWLSHDDLYFPTTIERAVTELQNRDLPQSILFADYDFLDVKAGIVTPMRLRELCPQHRLEHSLFAIFNLLLQGCALLIHRSHFERVGLFDPALKGMQDVEFFYRAFRGQRLVHLEGANVIGRMHAEQAGRAVPSFKVELCAMHRQFLDEITPDEIAAMFDHPATYYLELYNYFLLREDEEYAAKAAALYAASYDYMDAQPRIDAFKATLGERVYIFGAGDFGIRALYAFKARGIAVDGFIDNNPAKQGQLVRGVPCLSLDQAAQHKSQVTVVAAITTAQSLVQPLKSAGFAHVLDKFQLDTQLLSVPPLPLK